ncbi:hypothetical protein ACOSQ3_004801 [Xanthoceras sorbifolium]
MGGSKDAMRGAAAHAFGCASALPRDALDGWTLDDVFAKLGLVLFTPKSPTPTDESIEEQRGEYEQWESSDEMAKCYIMATMFNTAADIMMSLEEMFTMRSKTTKREAMTAFMNLRMKPGQAVKDHMMKVIAHLNIIELNGVEIDSETKIDKIVNLLLDSFDQFKLDYSLNNKEYTLQGLMQDVQRAEKILLKGKGQKIHLVGKVAIVKNSKKVKKQHKKNNLVLPGRRPRK